MLPQKQEKLLAALRKQLDTLAAAGVLSAEQLAVLGKLRGTHDRATHIVADTVPRNDAAFEADSIDAFPDKVTDDELRVLPMSACRRELGLYSTPSPTAPPLNLQPNYNRSASMIAKQITDDGWDHMSSFATDGGAAAGGTQGQSHFGEAPPVPALYNIVDPPLDDAGITDFIQQFQNERCAACQKKIERTKLGFGVFKAKFCHECNAFCCENCINGLCRCVLPSYAMLRWDFTPKVVRNAYGMDAEMEFVRPVLCPGAENPQLFDMVPILQGLRKLRLQLSKLVEIGGLCDDFNKSLTTEPSRPVLAGGGGGGPGGGGAAAAPASPSTTSKKFAKASFFVSERQRYLIHESEMWALADLEQVHSAAPSGKVPANQSVPLAASLQSTRDAMIRHVLTECTDCKLRAAHVCLECQSEHPIYSFDVRNVVECVRCTAVFHRGCWEALQKEERTCPGCAGHVLSDETLEDA